MEHLLVLPFMDKSRPVPVGCRPATGGSPGSLLSVKKITLAFLLLLRRCCANRNHTSHAKTGIGTPTFPLSLGYIECRAARCGPTATRFASLVALIPP